MNKLEKIDTVKLIGLLAPICYFTWVSMTYFTQIVFGRGTFDDVLATVNQMVALGGYLVVLAWRAFGRGFTIPIPAARCYVWSLMATAGTLGMELMQLLPFVPGSFCIAIASSLLAGVGFTFVLVYWIAQYANRPEQGAPLEVGSIWLGVAVLSALLIALPEEPAVICIALLPLAAGVSVTWTATHDDRVDTSAGTVHPAQEHPFRLPSAFMFGVCAIGFVYGLTQDFALAYRGAAADVALDCMLVYALVGAGIIICARVTGKNFGFSPLVLGVLPLAGLAQGMIATFHTDHLIMSFFVMRLAYVLFDSMLILQLPRVFDRIHTIRVYLFVRMLFEGSLAVGMLLHKVLMFFGFVAFDVVALVCLALLLAALTYSFATDNIVTAWRFMPVQRTFTGKFRRACRQLEEEYGLTNRESEIFELALRGRSGPYIQERLVISKNTYQTHMRNLYAKLEVHSAQEMLDLLEECLDENKSAAV